MSDQTTNNTLNAFERNRYFYGKLMTVRDFETEQDYMNGKRYLLNRLFDGAGIVCGLGDAAPYVEGDIVKISFPEGGTALDCSGHEIVVPPGSDKEVTRQEGQELVALKTAEIGDYPFIYLVCEPREKELVPSAAQTSGCDETCCAGRIEEDFKLVASDQVPGTHTIVFPDLSTAQTGDKAGEDLKVWYQNQVAAACAPCAEEGVFIAALDPGSPAGTAVLDSEETGLHLSVAVNNKLITALLTHHMSDFDNPHHVTAEQVGAFPYGGRHIDGTVSITSSGQQISITGCRQLSITSSGQTISIASPGALYVKSACNYAVYGSLAGGPEVPSIHPLLFSLGRTVTFPGSSLQPTTLEPVTGEPSTEPVTDTSITSLADLLNLENQAELLNHETLKKLLDTLEPAVLDRIAKEAYESAFSGNPSPSSNEAGLIDPKKGPPKFTLIELQIVVAIIAILSGSIPTTIKGISSTAGGLGVVAMAPFGTPALLTIGESYFASVAEFMNGMSGYMLSTFTYVDTGSGLLYPGDVVKLDGGNAVTLVNSGFGIDFPLVLPTIVPVDGTDPNHIVGIVHSEVQLGPDQLPGNHHYYVVTQGVYRFCRVVVPPEALQEPLDPALGIQVGDLLTSSATAGFAEKADPPVLGSILGKALLPYPGTTGTASTTGVIPVLVNIH